MSLHCWSISCYDDVYNTPVSGLSNDREPFLSLRRMEDSTTWVEVEETLWLNKNSEPSFSVMAICSLGLASRELTLLVGTGSLFPDTRYPIPDSRFPYQTIVSSEALRRGKLATELAVDVEDAGRSGLRGILTVCRNTTEHLKSQKQYHGSCDSSKNLPVVQCVGCGGCCLLGVRGQQQEPPVSIRQYLPGLLRPQFFRGTWRSIPPGNCKSGQMMSVVRTQQCIGFAASISKLANHGTG
ncbi:hypothetical protein B0T17DRAFT_539547 [Bombardia bombarda]|uniref:Uncharacterized protein n=1 Tax=Bombardia bombarda TaxID=252184 RepID=A0AA40BW44_9PEZI|nr:hypothetical protein B0T17DRAFT_539547 [Bombardia bombarda]